MEVGGQHGRRFVLFATVIGRKRMPYSICTSRSGNIRHWCRGGETAPSYSWEGHSEQARSQVLGFGGAQYIFRGEIVLFFCMFKTNYFVNFRRLTVQHIASCLFSISSHKICDCTGMLRAMGSQAGEEDSRAFFKYSKTLTFSGKRCPHKTKNNCLAMRFSPETTKKTNMKKFAYASRYFSDYAPVLDICLSPLTQ